MKRVVIILAASLIAGCAAYVEPGHSTVVVRPPVYVAPVQPYYVPPPYYYAPPPVIITPSPWYYGPRYPHHYRR